MRLFEAHAVNFQVREHYVILYYSPTKKIPKKFSAWFFNSNSQAINHNKMPLSGSLGLSD
jgi:hypothetical protein